MSLSSPLLVVSLCLTMVFPAMLLSLLLKAKSERNPIYGLIEYFSSSVAVLFTAGMIMNRICSSSWCVCVCVFFPGFI